MSMILVVKYGSQVNGLKASMQAHVILSPAPRLNELKLKIGSKEKGHLWLNHKSIEGQIIEIVSMMTQLLPLTPTYIYSCM